MKCDNCIFRHACEVKGNQYCLLRKEQDEKEVTDEQAKKKQEANDRQCEKCRHKVETKPGVEACDVWDCSFEPKDEQS